MSAHAAQKPHTVRQRKFGSRPNTGDRTLESWSFLPLKVYSIFGEKPYIMGENTGTKLTLSHCMGFLGCVCCCGSKKSTKASGFVENRKRCLEEILFHILDQAALVEADAAFEMQVKAAVIHVSGADDRDLVITDVHFGMDEPRRIFVNFNPGGSGI